jgi:hypothetical protein
VRYFEHRGLHGEEAYRSFINKIRSEMLTEVVENAEWKPRGRPLQDLQRCPWLIVQGEVRVAVTYPLQSRSVEDACYFHVECIPDPTEMAVVDDRFAHPACGIIPRM